MKKLIAASALTLTAFVGIAVPAQAATGRASGAPAEGGPVTAAHFDCSDNEDGNYPDPNDSSGYIACVAHQHVYAMPCAKGHDGQRLFYVANSGPDPAKSRCDYREVSNVRPTLTAGALRPQGTPGVVKALTATMDLGGRPVEAARIPSPTTRAGGSVRRTPTTKASPPATCSPTPPAKTSPPHSPADPRTRKKTVAGKPQTQSAPSPEPPATR